MPRFDEVVDIITRVLDNTFAGATPETIIVRDATGSATVVLPDDSLPAEEWNGLAQELHRLLGCYSPGLERGLLHQGDLIDPGDILLSQDRIRLPETHNISLVDRLLTNQDWLRPPVVNKPAIPTATAFSIKGGVGRSTAFAILAWYLARQDKRVMVIDLDLEAPGIGSLLLDELPDYGLADWLVENLVNTSNEALSALLEEMLAPSPLAANTSGAIHVVPAFGKKTRDYVAKVGRIYMPVATDTHQMRGLANHLSTLLDQMARRLEPPDVILLDARAGLHDIGAAAVTQLGAEAFLFARNDAQSWDAYKRLFDHLRLARTVKWGMPEEDLRWRLKMVAAQLDMTESALERWRDASYSTWTHLYDSEEEDAGETAQIFEPTEENAPHHPLPIIFDPRVRGLNLVSPHERPDWTFIEAAFGRFLKGATARLLEAPSIDPREEAGP